MSHSGGHNVFESQCEIDLYELLYAVFDLMQKVSQFFTVYVFCV